jgi:hypothetical protein
MYTSEIIFIYNKLLHVSAAHVSIFSEMIQWKQFKDDTVIEVTTILRYKMTIIQS